MPTARAKWLAWLGLAAASAPALAMECEHVAASATTLAVCRVDVRRDDLHLFLNDASGAPLRTFDALERMLAAQGKRLAFAVNAGMFHASRAPVGLLVEQRREVGPLNTSGGAGNFFLKPNGVFFVNAKGAGVAETDAFARTRGDTVLATQSGPLLVIGGRLHPKLNPNSTSRFIRNGVGVDDAGTVVFATSSSPMTLHEFAVAFRDTLKCPNALYLDGSVSSIYAPTLNERIQRADLGPIIAVVEPLPATTSTK
jgi:uncharacterized protein YigE (DUF2233 family)